MKHVSALIVVVCFCVLLLFPACKTQNLRYPAVKTSQDSAAFFQASQMEHIIRTDDKLNLSIQGHDDLSIGSVYGIYNANEVYGRWVLVDPDGFAALPRVGQVHLAGLTVSQAEDSLTAIFGKWIVNPIVRLRVLNRQISVLGEVKSPGLLMLEKEQNTLAECLARSGDFDFYADKKHIQVARMLNDTLKCMSIDLTDPEQAHLNKLSVKPGDIVYVPSRRGKVWDKRSGSIVTVTGIITTIVVVTQIFK
jgi:polysaccharide export outer membrane protein